MSASSFSNGHSRILSLSVDTSGPWSAVDSSSSSGGGSPTAAISGGFARGGSRAPPPPKSPLHGARRAAPQAEEAVPGLESRGVDRLLMLRQMNVTSSAGYQSTSVAHSAAPRPNQPPRSMQPMPVVHEVSAAQNHKERKAAEARRRQEVALMTHEDYTGTPEGFARLARQEERANMQEEEVRMARIVLAEKAELRAQQVQAQREEETRIREMYLAKLRAEREENERAAKEKELARKQAAEEKMKALKAAADAKARDEYAARQRQLAAEALAKREQRICELESAQLAVEDELAAAMRQDFLAELERRQQIAAEEAQWKLFQEAEAQRQLEATMKRRALQAAQYEQDKQRRMEIHRLQKERARLVAEKKSQKQPTPKEQQSEAVDSHTLPPSSLQEQVIGRSEGAEAGVNTEIKADGESTSSTRKSPRSDDDIKTTTASALQDDASKANLMCPDLHETEATEPQQEPLASEALASSRDGTSESNDGQCEPLPPVSKVAVEDDATNTEANVPSSCAEPAQLLPSARREDNDEKESKVMPSIQPTENNNADDHRGDVKEERQEIDERSDQEKPSKAHGGEEAPIQSMQVNALPGGLDQETCFAGEQSVVTSTECLVETASSTEVVDNTVPTVQSEQVREEVAQEPEPTPLRSNSTEVVASLPEGTPHRLLSTREARGLELEPFAQVLHVKDGSPAMEAALRAGDLVANFGGITGFIPNCLLLIADKVKCSVGKGIKLIVLRPHEDNASSVSAEGDRKEMFTCEELLLQPRKWKGKGLLGCQLNPFKWAEEENVVLMRDPEIAPGESQQAIEDTATTSSNLLVFYNVVSDSVADQIGIKNGDLLMRCGALEAVGDLSAVLGYFQVARGEHAPIELEIQRWLPEEQHYQQFVLMIPVLINDEPLGCSMTTFAEYYGIVTTYAAADTPALSACTECYYTNLATAVHAAALNGHVTCLEALLEAARQCQSDRDDQPSAVLDWRDEDGRSPLFYACYSQQVESVKFLLAHLAREDVFDPQSGSDLYGDTPLHAAATSGTLEILTLLLESKYIAVDVVNATQLACVHVAPNVEVLRLLGERFGADLLVADSDGRMPLSHACLRGDLESVKYLCEKHPDFVDYADWSGNTPLHLSAWLGLVEVLKELVKHVPTIALYLPNQDGSSPLEIARSNGFEEAAQFLEECMAASSGDGSGGGGGRVKENDFMKYISIDLSSLESRFEQIFAKLEALETRMNLAPVSPELAAAFTVYSSGVSDSKAAPGPGNGAPSAGGGGDRIESSVNSGSENKVVDLIGLAKEIESLRAAQLRLKIDQEVVQSTLRVDVETLRHDLELVPQHSDLGSFRAEIDVLLTNNLKAVQTLQAQLEHSMNLTLSERELAENKWKSVFEETIAARIQDLWSGMHSTSRKLQESMQFLQTDMVKQEELTREMGNSVEQMKNKAAAFERDSLDHAAILAEQAKGIEQLTTLCTQADAKLTAQEAGNTNHAAALTERLDAADSLLLAAQKKYDAFASEVNTTLQNVCGDLVSCQTSLQAHQETMHSLDAGIMRQNAELMRMTDQLVRSDAKLGNIDGRVAAGEKKTATIASVIQEHHQEMQHHVSQISASLEQAAAERGSMKRANADLHFTIQETQHKLDEVGKLATTTDFALTRTAAELSKVHALAATNASNIAKNRQTIRDLNCVIDEEKVFSQTLQSKFEKESTHSAARFAEVAKRGDATQKAIEDAASTTQNIKHALEEAIRYNSNMIHQLNTMVDSIAITESSDGMEDKLSRFALSVAELGLKLEHFGKNAPTSGMVREDIKAELAVLLTKVIRFLGSGVSIDQNKYLFTAKRQQYVDPSSGAIIFEMPPQQVLEGFRLAKATLFSSKMRGYMDQLQPVLHTNKHSIEFRDSFERKLQFMIEFGLANLFPNVGKTRNPQSKRLGNLGTCIACDRPIDDAQLEEQPQEDDATGNGALHRGHTHSSEHNIGGASTSFSEDLVAEEHRLRRQRLVSSAGPTSRIDTKSTIRGRSGNSGLRPKSTGEPVHHAPGTVDFIYRAGFRLPKPVSATAAGGAQQQGGTPSKSVSAAALLFSGVIAHSQQTSDTSDHANGLPQGYGLLDDGSSLEKVALSGKCQATVEIPNAELAMVRPHTAPHRTKSLPRLESVSLSSAVAPTGETQRALES